ncbi:MAG: 2-amino-4-hydroxy-6-hydroxymethyldihydropteridine diphosphokinase, partial [Enterobacteriaceae bacterium]
YVALGSNLGESVAQANSALKALRALPESELVACSSFYRSKPMGPQDQPDYLNAVIHLLTALTPEALLDHLQTIEHNLGRVCTGEHWGPRTLDLDLLLYGTLQMHSERLTIPHYGMKQREFVLYPLHELAPELILPDGTVLSELLDQIPRNGLSYWDS